MEKVKLGFVGCGYHAIRNMYPSLQYSPIELVAVCARHEESAKKTAKLFGAKSFYTDYRRMFQSEELDAVCVVTPPQLHPEITIDALRNGLHVLVEKPIAYEKDMKRTLDKAREIREVSRETEKFVMVAFMKRFGLAYKRAKEIISGKDFGLPTHITSKFCPHRSTDRTPHDFLVITSGHHLDLVRFFMGDAERVYAEKNIRGNQIAAAVSLRFKSGAVGQLHLSTQQPTESSLAERVEITGEESFVIVDNVVNLKWAIGKEPARLWEPPHSWNADLDSSLFLAGFASEMQHFAESVLQNRPPKPDANDGYEALKLAKAISECEGSPIRMDQVR